MNELSTLPRHVAIIPDGNRRWAKEQGMSSLEGHTAGAKAFRAVALHAAEAGVDYLSMWGMSLSNFTSRSPLEVAGLLKIFHDEFTALKDSEDVHRLKIKIQAFGRWREKFPASLIRAIEAAQDATAQYSDHYLNFFLAYSGTDEMMAAIQKMVEAGKTTDLQVTPEMIKQSLFTKDLPPVDLVIRTAGEPHLSAGFMMWDVADAELSFSAKLWPEFTSQDFDEALAYFAGRERRLGK